MASILFLSPADLGEVVLATGVLAHVVGERDALCVAAPGEAMQLFRAAPGLVRTLTLERGAMESLRAWPALARLRPDIVIDGRGGTLASCVPKRRTISPKPGARLRHITQAWGEAVGAGRTLPPVLWLDTVARAAAGAVVGEARSILVIAPGGVSNAKLWPAERFAAVARRLKTGVLAEATVIVLSAAARDQDVCDSIVRSLESDGVAAQSVGDGFDLLAAAALMERATLCIGNDNALTHIAAAMGAPTLTLFGPTDERLRAPWGARVRTLRGMGLDEIAALGRAGGRAAMDAMSIDAVEAASLDLLRAGGLG